MHVPIQDADSRRGNSQVQKKGLSSDPDLVNLAGSEIVGEPTVIVIIEPRVLNRECLARCLGAVQNQIVLAFSTVEDWLKERDTVTASVILLGIPGAPREAEARHQLSLLMQCTNPPPIAILSDVEEPEQIIEMLHAGVRGYIPTSLPLDVAIESMRLVRAGGIFAPASSLIAVRRSRETARPARLAGSGMFTARQAAVVEALRRGKANKIIAYELNMSESTVKVHVRNIMKKLRAKNRTEVAFMTTDQGSANALAHVQPTARGKDF